MNREVDLIKLRHLYHNEQCTVAWCDEGGGEVHRVWDMLFLFYIPQYGGEGQYEGSFHISDAERLLDVAYNWS